MHLIPIATWVILAPLAGGPHAPPRAAAGDRPADPLREEMEATLREADTRRKQMQAVADELERRYRATVRRMEQQNRELEDRRRARDRGVAVVAGVAVAAAHRRDEDERVAALRRLSGEELEREIEWLERGRYLAAVVGGVARSVGHADRGRSPAARVGTGPAVSPSR